jgi:hypothetical protein
MLARNHRSILLLPRPAQWEIRARCRVQRTSSQCLFLEKRTPFSEYHVLRAAEQTLPYPSPGHGGPVEPTRRMIQG